MSEEVIMAKFEVDGLKEIAETSEQPVPRLRFEFQTPRTQSSNTTGQ